MGSLGIMASARRVPAPTYYGLVLADNPTSYWRLGESSGTNAVDEKGAHAGTYVNSVAFSQAGALIGDANTAVLFSGSPAEYVNVAGFTTVPALVTIEAWVKATTFNDSGLAGWYDAGNVATALIYINSSGVIFFYLKDLTGDTTYNASATITNGNWHRICVTYDGTQARLYYDGALVAGPITKSFSGGTSSNTFKIANYGAPDGTAFAGTVDEVAIYPSALASARDLAHYHAAGY